MLTMVLAAFATLSVGTAFNLYLYKKFLSRSEFY